LALQNAEQDIDVGGWRDTGSNFY